MSRLLVAFAATAVAFAAPAAAQGPGHDLPSSADIAGFAPVIDRMVGALMNLDVGPVMDAADPLARHPGYGVPGRTLGAMGRARDPYFDRRVRGAIYGGTAQAGRMMDAFAAAMPALERSLHEVERGMAAAVDSYHSGAAPYPEAGYDDEGPADGGPWGDDD